jgi:DNA-binding NarL/FixJ family response regulator
MVPMARPDYPRRVPDVVIASDEAWVREEVRSVLSGQPDVQVLELASGPEVVAAVRASEPDLVIVDSQMGNMGAMATCLELRLDESADRIVHVPVLMLLDRRADVFLARRSQAEGWLVKPLDPIRLRRAVTAVLAGGTYEDAAFRPVAL